MPYVRESFCESGEGSQRKGLTSGEVPELPGKFGELPGKSGKLPGNLWIAVKFHSGRTSGEVAENFLRGSSGNFRGSPGTSQTLVGSLTPHQRLAKFVSNYGIELRPCLPARTGISGLRPPEQGKQKGKAQKTGQKYSRKIGNLLKYSAVKQRGWENRGPPELPRNPSPKKSQICRWCSVPSIGVVGKSALPGPLL